MPLVSDGVVVDWASFANDTIRVRAHVFAPGWARLVDAGRVAGQAEEVLVRGRVVVGEPGRVDVELGHGGRNGRGSRKDGRIVCLVIESGDTQLEELRVEVEGSARSHWETKGQ